jgi:hypothetical protein
VSCTQPSETAPTDYGLLGALDGSVDTTKDSTTAAPRLRLAGSALCGSTAEPARSQAERRAARQLRHPEPLC